MKRGLAGLQERAKAIGEGVAQADSAAREAMRFDDLSSYDQERLLHIREHLLKIDALLLGSEMSSES